jgi:glycosyltransferase involved in cell wall biosynthesis
MHIAICCNHSWPLIGGSEQIVRQVAERLKIRYSHEKVTVYSKSFIGQEAVHNGVTYKSVDIFPAKFISQLIDDQVDELLVYSDFFCHWNAILSAIDDIPFKVSIALVGMNYMRKNISVLNVFKQKIDKIKIITHSDKYIDYLTCKYYNIPVSVIPNGVDVNEFIENKDINFREKYNIKEKKIILCVSNFFPGKGQIETIPALEELCRNEKDFVVVYICSTINFPLGKILRQKCELLLKQKNIPHKILLDIPREYTIQAFLYSDVFFFPSQKEVAPLVILEASASGLPWVSFNVGNISELSGGIVVKNSQKDIENNIIIGIEENKEMCKNLKKILNNSDLRNKLSKDGRNMVLEKFDIDVVSKQYNDLFCRGF